MGKKKDKQAKQKLYAVIFVLGHIPEGFALQKFHFQTICVVNSADQPGNACKIECDSRLDVTKDTTYQQIEEQIASICENITILGIFCDSQGAVLASNIAQSLGVTFHSPLDLSLVTGKLRSAGTPPPEWDTPAKQMEWDWQQWVESTVPNACPSKNLKDEESAKAAIAQLQLASETFSQWRLEVRGASEGGGAGGAARCTSPEDLLDWLRGGAPPGGGGGGGGGGARGTRLQMVPAGREFEVAAVSRPPGDPRAAAAAGDPDAPPPPPPGSEGVQHKVLAIWEYLYSPRDGESPGLVVKGSRILIDPTDATVPYAALVESTYAALSACGVRCGPARARLLVAEGGGGGGGCHLLGLAVGAAVREDGTGGGAHFEREALGGKKAHLATAMDCLTALPDAFDARPAAGPRGPLPRAVAEVPVHSGRGGVVRAVPGRRVAAKLRSRAEVLVKPQPWGFLAPAGPLGAGGPAARVVLAHADSPAALEADLAALRPYEAGRPGFVDFEVVCARPAAPRPLQPPTADSMDGGPPGLNYTVGAVIVDPFSSGIELARYCHMNSIPVMTVYSQRNELAQEYANRPINPAATACYGGGGGGGGGGGPQAPPRGPPGAGAAAAAVIDGARVQALAAELAALPFTVGAVVPGAETGVELADALARAAGCRGNAPATSALRCDKYAMGSALRRARLPGGGRLRTAREARCRNVLALEAVLMNWGRTKENFGKVVVKPPRGCGTEDVALCESPGEAYAAVRRILGRPNSLGVVNDAALVQEYIESEAEYAIDSVSRDGIHKIVAIWEYDKRSHEGANFVYYGMKIVGVGVRADLLEMIKYHHKVLDVLGVTDGPAHTEILRTKNGPVFVEIGARVHGGSGSWLPIADACVGHNQFAAALECHLKPSCFDALPAYPFALLAHGREVHLVNAQEGRVKAVPGEALVKKLASYRDARFNFQPGMEVVKTSSCFTRPGSVQLVHISAAQVDADYEAVRRMEREGRVYEIEPIPEEGPDGAAEGKGGAGDDAEDAEEKAAAEAARRRRAAQEAEALRLGDADEEMLA